MKSARRWAPRNKVARVIVRMLLQAHRDEVIKLGSWTEVQVREWQVVGDLWIGPRMKLGALWRTHGRTILEHRKTVKGAELPPEHRDCLVDVLVEAS